ncbi:hypothetical protein IWW47_004416 [Coemansia sp. RSA 2052]|nr:hypothetical protein IWW47_004416 [Coemansia sp. RSA 2052]
MEASYAPPPAQASPNVLAYSAPGGMPIQASVAPVSLGYQPPHYVQQPPQQYSAQPPGPYQLQQQQQQQPLPPASQGYGYQYPAAQPQAPVTAPYTGYPMVSQAPLQPMAPPSVTAPLGYMQQHQSPYMAPTAQQQQHHQPQQQQPYHHGYGGNHGSLMD